MGLSIALLPCEVPIILPRSSGRKSEMTSALMGSLVYLTLLLLIDRLAPAPVSGADDSNDLLAVGEANRQDASTNRAEAVEPSFGLAMREILGNYAVGVGEGVLGLRERRQVAIRLSGGSDARVQRRDERAAPSADHGLIFPSFGPMERSATSVS